MFVIKLSSWLKSEHSCKNLHGLYMIIMQTSVNGAFDAIRNCRLVWNWWSGTMSWDRSLVFRYRPTMNCAISKICQHSIQRRASRWWSGLASSLQSPQTSRPPLQLHTKQQHLHLVPKLWRSSGPGIRRNGQWGCHHVSPLLFLSSVLISTYFHEFIELQKTCVNATHVKINYFLYRIVQKLFNWHSDTFKV